MIVKAWHKELELVFNKAAKTSRDTLLKKTSHYLMLEDELGKIGIGECSPIYGLSIENETDLHRKINEVIYLLNHKKEPEDIELNEFPSLRFALECASLDLKNGGKRKIFDTGFSRGESSIRINGLIWMSSITDMKAQLKTKIEKGFTCIKLKIGALDFNSELELLKQLRLEFGNDLELRLDANGAFGYRDALEALKKLSEFSIHSIEQPIKQGNWEKMADICKTSPIPIALDEELIGIDQNAIPSLLDTIKPQYIILKPTLLGGLEKCQEWISEGTKRKIGWWATSALESNIGLNAIAQWVSTYKSGMYQGLGTGQLYKNNIPSALVLEGENLHYNKREEWELNELLF